MSKTFIGGAGLSARKDFISGLYASGQLAFGVSKGSWTYHKKEVNNSGNAPNTVVINEDHHLPLGLGVDLKLGLGFVF